MLLLRCIDVVEAINPLKMPPNGAQSLRFNMLYQFLPKLNPKLPIPTDLGA